MNTSSIQIDKLGEPKISSPLKREETFFISEKDKIFFKTSTHATQHSGIGIEDDSFFECAGPREKVYFNPTELNCGIVTCGGLCPGLNDVIRSITLCLYFSYGVKNVIGFRYGYEGLSSNARLEPLHLNPREVENIHSDGGTILGSSRGPQDVHDMVQVLKKNQIGILFIIGGDGTFSGAHEIAQILQKEKNNISVIGIPKTIDNDICLSDLTFGFQTAVEEACRAIAAAHEEAKAAWNGIGLVKLMGRDSGFIAAHAAIANSDVNICLVPEVPFELKGEKGLLNILDNRLKRRGHAVIVTAEGAGQHLITEKKEKDASGNTLHQDIGLFLKDEISNYFKKNNTPFTLKYIDPSYMIRSCKANALDSALCAILGQNAVHAGMSGRTNMFISRFNEHFMHVPFSLVIGKRKKLHVDLPLWQAVRVTTERIGHA